MTDCCCIPKDDFLNQERIFEQEYWLMLGRDMRDAEYREGPFAIEHHPFDSNNRQRVEMDCHRRYGQAVVISKMTEEEFSEGVMKRFAKAKADYDEERMHRQLRILKTIPKDLIKAYLSMEQTND